MGGGGGAAEMGAEEEISMNSGKLLFFFLFFFKFTNSLACTAYFPSFAVSSDSSCGYYVLCQLQNHILLML